AEVDIFQVGLDGLKIGAWRRIGVDMGDGSSRVEFRRDHWSLAFELTESVRRNHAAPDAAMELLDGAEGLGFEQNLPLIDDGHPRAQLTHILHNVRGKKDDAVLAQFAQQVQESHANWARTASSFFP